MQVTDEEFKSWLPAPEALRILTDAYGNVLTAISTLLQHLNSGVVQGVALTVVGANPQRPRVPVKLFAIPQEWWLSIHSSSPFWVTGHTDLWYRPPTAIDKFHATLIDVRFKPEAIRAIIGNLAPTADMARPSALVNTQSAPQRHKGGRPPKDFWQDFWIEMCRLIYEGDIKAEMTQADIARYMHQWVSDHGHDAGDTVIKEAARKLKKALE